MALRNPSDASIEITPPDLLGIVDDGVRTLARDPGPGRPGFVRCSSLAPRDELCLKRLQLERMGAAQHPKAMDVEMCWRLLTGSALHEVCARAFAAAGARGESGVYYESLEIGLAGEIDHRYVDDQDRSWVVDDKFMAAAVLRFLKKPVRRHVWQMEGYMLLTGCDRAVLHYRSPGPQEPDNVHDLIRRAHQACANEEARQHLSAALFALREPKVPSALMQLRKIFGIRSNWSIRSAILELLEEVTASIKLGRWLPENRKQCVTCPFRPPCHAGLSFEEVKRSARCP
jgi:hypothetical protein